MRFKKILTKKNIGNALFISLFLVIIFVPSAKALVLQGLMEVGLFKPSITTTSNSKATLDLGSIRFKDSKDQVLSLADLKGKVIFLNFWATWCPPCLAEMPSINQLYQQFAGDEGVAMLLIDADGNFKKSQAYFDRKKYKMPIFAAASSIPQVLFSGSLPTTLVLDKKGQVVYNGVGVANYANPKFVSFIKELKASKD